MQPADSARPAGHEPGELARLSSIIQSAMDGIITVDESQRIVMFNPAAERIFDIPVAEAMGSSLDRFIPERFRRAHGEHIRSFGRTGVTMRAMGRLGTISGLRADGTEFPIEASISQAVTDGKRLFTVILRDVTERRKLEEQLIQSQKMEGIGRLAGGVAHDFNNLLMAVFNYLALAARKLEPDHPAQSALGHAREAAERAANLTRQLLAFARKQPVAPRVLRARDAVASLEPMLRQLVGENTTLRVLPAADTWSVRVDPTQLTQVIMNLAVNARDAMPRGGTLTIETGNAVLRDGHAVPGLSPGDHVVITVTDTGVGMSREVLQRLFEPFFTTKPPGQGTGLGLATCHGIVRQCGGHIAAQSEPGRGTSMRVYLPRAGEDHPAASGAAAAAVPAGGAETLLLVEDSPMVRDLVAEGLRAAGYTVLAAPTPADAVRMAEAHARIDMLITDVMLPGMNGVELAAALEQSRSLSRAIFMSGSTDGDVPARDGTPRVFMAKPFTVEALLRKVREVLDARA